MSHPGLKTNAIVLCALGMLPLLEGRALACGTCSLDSGGPGQVLMLIAMLAMPLFVAGVGFAVIRRIVAKGQG